MSTEFIDREIKRTRTRLERQKSLVASLEEVHANAKAAGLHALTQISAARLLDNRKLVSATETVLADLLKASKQPSPPQTDIESEAPPAPLKGSRR